MRLSVLFLCLWIFSPVSHAAKLYVNATPNDAKIQLLSRKATFSQGVELSPGKYYLAVSKLGYRRYMQPVVLKSEDVTLDIVLQPKEQQSTTAAAPTVTQSMYPLYIYPLPKDASVELVDATAAFQQGMSLPTGIYHVRVSKAGYVSRHEWIKLGKGGSKVKIELSQPNSCYFAEEKIDDNQEIASILRNVTLKPRGDLLEVSYYEQKLPTSEATHLELIGVNRGKHIKLIGTFDNHAVSEEITAELLIYKDSLSIHIKGIEAMLNETACF
jgi:hypothetical protein